MADDTNDITDIKQKFEKAVSKRKWSMIRENSVPLIMPPVIVAGGLFAAALGAWDVLPAMGQKIAVMGSAAAIAATTAASFLKPLFNKKSSPVISSKQAINAIDNDINSDEMPARKMADQPAEYSKDGWNELFELSKKQVWNKWGTDLENQKSTTGFGRYYNNGKGFKAVAHGAILSAAIATASFNGDGAFQKFQDAWNFTPPPPPLVYAAWVTPPDGIADAPVYQDGMLRSTLDDDENLPAHEGSVLSIVTYDRAGEILVNGQILNPEAMPDQGIATRNDTVEFSYLVPLDEGDVNISIEGHSYNFTVTPDNPPILEILNTQPDDFDPSSIVLEYTITDDFGAAGAEISIGVPDGEGRSATPLLPSAQIPSFAIPHTDRPDAP